MKVKKYSKVIIMCIFMVVTAGCGNSKKQAEEPPAEVINPSGSSKVKDSADIKSPGSVGNGDVIKGAVTAKIGLNDGTGYTIDMYNNTAAEIILGYLSGEEMRFPTYTYEEKDGYVAQNIRGNYTREDEQEISQIKAGELYLFSDGQLRLYFKDKKDAGIIATPVGYFTDVDNITELVQNAYEENRDDSWGVDVYFLITKN